MNTKRRPAARAAATLRTTAAAVGATSLVGLTGLAGAGISTQCFTGNIAEASAAETGTNAAEAEAAESVAQAEGTGAGGMDPARRELWDPAGESVTASTQPRLQLQSLDLDEETGELTASLRIENTTDSTITGVDINAWRGDRVDNPATARMHLAGGEYGYFGGHTSVGDIAAGNSTEVTMTVPADSGLGLGEAVAAQHAAAEHSGDHATLHPAVFPLQFTLTGSASPESSEAGAENAATLATERTLLDIPAGRVDEPEPGPEEDEPAEDNAPREEYPDLTVVYPLTAKLDILPGETGEQPLMLATDNLAHELAEGGRLDQLLDSYLSHDLHGAGCVALDPALVDTVDRMAGGYRVSTTRPKDVAKPQRLRDSWFSNTNKERGHEGTGAADARAWLDKLRRVDCTVSMPWANADPSAVAQAGNDFLTHEALDRGPETIERVTGRPVATDLLVPGPGFVSEPMPHPVLVANNSTWHGKAATFDASLGSLLAQAGPEPQTPGYSNPELRSDYAENSEYSRALTSAAALSLAATETHPAPADAADDPGAEKGEGPAVIAKLANLLDPVTAEETLTAAEQALNTGAHPKPLAEARLEDGTANDEEGVPAGSPFIDPAAFSAADVQQVGQQAGYTDDLMHILVDDPNIALSRYGYTLPLRRGLLQTLSVTERSSFRSHVRAVDKFRRRMDEHAGVLRELRASVALIPPGNVYTRVSDSSPLLIVAENGLPLPVDARMLYDAADGASLHTPEQVYIPARGSITVTMTADLPSEMDRTRLSLWLATPELDAISEPIDITVRTRAGIVSVYGVGLVAALIVLLALLFRVGRRKKFGRHR